MFCTRGPRTVSLGKLPVLWRRVCYRYCVGRRHRCCSWYYHGYDSSRSAPLYPAEVINHTSSYQLYTLDYSASKP